MCGRRAHLAARLALGAIVVTGVQGSLSDTPAFLETWTLIMGVLFIVVVLFLPGGLISLIDLVPFGAGRAHTHAGGRRRSATAFLPVR